MHELYKHAAKGPDGRLVRTADINLSKSREGPRGRQTQTDQDLLRDVRRLSAQGPRRRAPRP